MAVVLQAVAPSAGRRFSPGSVTTGYCWYPQISQMASLDCEDGDDCTEAPYGGASTKFEGMDFILKHATPWL